MATDAGTSPPDGELCEPPLLIVFVRGPGAEDLAGVLGEQCRATRVRYRVRPIDGLRDVDLARFPGLLLVLPTLAPGMNVRITLEPCARLVADYRLRWSHGLAEAVSGSVDPMDAGTVQLYGERALLHNPALRSTLRRACLVHKIDQDGPVDALRVYRRDAVLPQIDTPWQDSQDVMVESLEQTWAHLRSWGVVDMRSAPDLLACLKRCRKHFEDPNKPQLYRPNPEFQRNRLDIILEGPDMQIGNSKTWNENGARVCRYVLEQLGQAIPGVRRPGHPTAPGSQRDLRRFYISLKIADAWLKNSSGKPSGVTA